MKTIQAENIMSSNFVELGINNHRYRCHLFIPAAIPGGSGIGRFFVSDDRKNSGMIVINQIRQCKAIGSSVPGSTLINFEFNDRLWQFPVL